MNKWMFTSAINGSFKKPSPLWYYVMYTITSSVLHTFPHTYIKVEKLNSSSDKKLTLKQSRLAGAVQSRNFILPMVFYVHFQTVLHAWYGRTVPIWKWHCEKYESGAICQSFRLETNVQVVHKGLPKLKFEFATFLLLLNFQSFSLFSLVSWLGQILYFLGAQEVESYPTHDMVKHNWNVFGES